MKQTFATHDVDDDDDDHLTEVDRLKEEIFLLETLMDTIPDTIYFKDRASRFTRINRFAATVFGVGEPALAVGRTDFDYFTDECGFRTIVNAKIGSS